MHEERMMSLERIMCGWRMLSRERNMCGEKNSELGQNNV
jgi:uncharacterized protein YjiS (DUF1127 family)